MNAHALTDLMVKRNKRLEIVVTLGQFDIAFRIPKQKGHGFRANPVTERCRDLAANLGKQIRVHDGALIVMSGYIVGADIKELTRGIIEPVAHAYDMDYRIENVHEFGKKACWAVQQINHQ